jgi:hypothetical protein
LLSAREVDDLVHSAIRTFKEEHGIGKIAGLMMLHYFKWPWCLESLADYVDEIYIHLHATPSFPKVHWPLRVAKVSRCLVLEHEREMTRIENRKIGLMGTLRERTLRMLDEVKPDLVFFPDEDEAYGEPDLVARDLHRLIRSGKKQLAFHRCNFWDSMHMVRKDKWAYYRPHVKVYRWQPGLTYLPYAGFNRLTNYGRRKVVARTVIKHYAFLEKSERERRYRELLKGQEDKYAKLLSEPTLVPYTDALRAPRT